VKGARFFLPVLVLAAGALAAVALIASGPEVQRRAPEVVVPLVRVVVATPETIQHRIRTHGTVDPRTESELIPEVTGRVVWVSPALVSGGFFAHQDVLLRVDRADYEIALERARASLNRAESEHRRATRDLERSRGLAERKYASAAELDRAENIQHAAAATLREMRAALVQAERELARTELRAPYAGRVRQARVDVGQFVTRGASLATIYAVDYAEVRLPIPDEELAYLDGDLLSQSQDAEGGAEVILHARFAGRDRTWRGRIVRSEGEIDPKSRMVHVVARVEDPYGRESAAHEAPLAVGLFVDAEILGTIAEQVFVLPRASLRSGGRVLVVDAESRLRFRPVEVMRAAGESVVVAAGLQPGDRVCISPLDAPVDGMRVRVALDGESAGPEASGARS
jgi:RND family efflux transporter MFP subunit